MKLDPQFLQTMQVGKRAQHSEIGFPISTDDASWGNGPNIVKLDPQFLLTLQVGGQTQKLAESQLTITCKLGNGPNTEAGGKSASMNIIKS